MGWRAHPYGAGHDPPATEEDSAVKLLGKVALVTGSARGLGKASALALARAGATVIINDIPAAEAAAAATVDEFRRGDLNAEAALADVSAEAEVDALVAGIVARHGRLDILINNAGINRDSTIRKATSADWDRVNDVNLRGPFLCTRAAVGPMRAGGWGRIVNMASLAGQQGGAVAGAHYAASKAGIIVLTKIAAADLAAHGVTVNAVAPAAISGPIMDAMPQERVDALAARIPVGRVGRPGEVAELVAFLVSEDAGYITGATFDINGGLLMR